MDELAGKKIEYLSSFMTGERYSVLRDTLDRRMGYMTVCLENIFHPQNASAVVRSCEAFGIQHIHVVESLTAFTPNVNIVRGTDKWIDIHRCRGAGDPSAELVSKLKGDGFRIVATSPHVGSATPEDFDVGRGKFALFFGTEHEGISQTVAQAADEFIRIPMYGFVESLNISVSAAILLYTLSRRVREDVEGWELPDGEKRELLLKWMLSSVKDGKNIMKRFKP